MQTTLEVEVPSAAGRHIQAASRESQPPARVVRREAGGCQVWQAPLGEGVQGRGLPWRVGATTLHGMFWTRGRYRGPPGVVTGLRAASHGQQVREFLGLTVVGASTAMLLK